MMKDGYWLRKDDDGSPDLTIRTAIGYSCPRFTQEDLDAGRLKRVIASVRKEHAENPLALGW